MPGFLFDTNVLIDYLRDDTQYQREAEEALAAASEKGRIFISRVSIYELWAPEKWKISEKSANLVPKWIQKMNSGELPLGIIEMIEGIMGENYIELPTSCQIEVISIGKHWVITDESKRTFFQIQYQNGTLTIGSPDRRREEIEEDIQRIYQLRDKYGALIIDISRKPQDYAEIILTYHYQILGKNAITDALIIGSGLARRAYLVTNEITRWNSIAKDLRQRVPNIPYMKVITPVHLIHW